MKSWYKLVGTPCIIARLQENDEENCSPVSVIYLRSKQKVVCWRTDVYNLLAKNCQSISEMQLSVYAFSLYTVTESFVS